MRIITQKRLKEFWETPAGCEAERPLRAWIELARESSWKGPNDIKATLSTASILKNGRVVFNIGGNKFRLVTVIFYDVKIIFIRFIGTHAQYDRIAAQEV